MEKFLSKLKADFPDINFVSGDGFYWSPQSCSVIYKAKLGSKNFKWTFLHEIAHAKLKHISYSTDVQLLNMEVAAWEKARSIAKRYKITISEDHIQSCLDSYRDWLHQRSTCPRCESHSLQLDSRHYRCFNCHTTWKVSTARFCRPYRKIEIEKGTSQEVKPQVMFL